jgi:HEAT repeat protein
MSLLVAMLCDADRDLRQAAAEALGRLGDRRGESALTYALADPDPWVRHAAGQSLPMLAATPGAVERAP